MSDVHPFSHLSVWRKPAFVIVVAGVLTFFIWTLPNWGAFWSNVAQFPVLWQIPANRRIIIYLSIKIASPLFMMGNIGIILQIYYLMKPQYSESSVLEKEYTTPEIEKKDEPDPAFSMQEQKTPGVSLFPLPHPPFSFVSSSANPEDPHATPLALEVQKKQMEGSIPSISLVENEVLVPPVEQQRENDAAGDTSTKGTLVQTVDMSSQVIAQSTSSSASQPLISLRLLKDVSMIIHVPGGGHVVVPLTLNAKRVQLLAYIAWRRGELIDRDKILEHVFGWGLSDEEATEDKLSERFESHKKLLRRKIREVVIEQINKPAGRDVIDPDIDPFVNNSGFWGLADICRVDDIEAIETHYKVISLARKDGQLVDEIPDYVKESCEQLIARYSGDFLESLIKKYPGEFQPWQGRGSWIRKPYTHYRDCYLDALWYTAKYDWRMGQRYTLQENTERDEAKQRKQQAYFGRAAQKYQSYAMYACNSRFDAKVTFSTHGEFGERVGMSERALRRCVMLFGAIGKTDLVDQVWSAYYTQMKNVSSQRWQPGKETLADVQSARSQTNSYRFVAQNSRRTGEF